MLTRVGPKQDFLQHPQNPSISDCEHRKVSIDLVSYIQEYYVQTIISLLGLVLLLLQSLINDRITEPQTTNEARELRSRTSSLPHVQFSLIILKTIIISKWSRNSVSYVTISGDYPRIPSILDSIPMKELNFDVKINSTSVQPNRKDISNRVCFSFLFLSLLTFFLSFVIRYKTEMRFSDKASRFRILGAAVFTRLFHKRSSNLSQFDKRNSKVPEDPINFGFRSNGIERKKKSKKHFDIAAGNSVQIAIRLNIMNE